MNKQDPPVSKANKATMWRPLLWSLGMAFTGIAVSWCGCEIVLTTGPWAMPLLIAYVALLVAPASIFLAAKEKYTDRFMMGEELFYRTYPEEFAKAMRRVKRKGLSADTRRVLAEYEQNMAPEAERKGQGDPGRFRRLFLLLPGAAGCAALGLGLIGSQISGFGRLFPLGEKSDFTPLLSVLAGFFCLLTAFFWLRRKRSTRVMGVTLTILIANAWACFIAATIRKTYSRTEFFLLLGSILLYVLAGVLLPVLAGDVRTQAQKKAAERDFILGLFALGAIDEEELGRRLA